MRRLSALALAACLQAGSAHALVITTYQSLADWQTDAGASVLQDFSSFANGASLQGAEVLPGVTITTNLGALQVFNPEKAAFAFGSGAGSRAAGNAFYDLNVHNAYRALALDLGAYESSAPPFNIPASAVDAGVLQVFFQDGFIFDFPILGNDGLSNIFVGFIADTPITSARWIEAHEISGGNEETTLDNLRVALPVRTVPEPSTLLLAGGGLLLLARTRRR